MIFDYTLTIPANTPESAPEPLELPLTHGIIHKIAVIFQAGCRHQVSLVIKRGLHQVWPTNPDGALKGDFFPIEGPVWYELEDEPYVLEAYGWSPGTTYDHVVTIRLWIARREILIPPSESEGIISKLGKYFFGTGK